MNAHPADDSLSETLAAWRVAPTRDPQFRASVWSRIERVRRELSWSGYVRLHVGLVAGALAVAVVAGGWIGRDQARARVAAEREAIVSNYVQALDARTMRMP